PYARRLAGPMGPDLVRRLSGLGGTWPIVARTYIIDGLVEAAIRDGADAVLNLAAGFDSRPYRLKLPKTLVWIEVDQADVMAAKEADLHGETPACQLERVVADLSQDDRRQALLAKVGARFKRVFVMTEGLLCYLPKEVALGLAKD